MKYGCRGRMGCCTKQEEEQMSGWAGCSLEIFKEIKEMFLEEVKSL